MTLQSTARLDGEFEYIVVGAGSAGCVMANRLSADPTNRVLVLEAGGRDNWIWFHIPVGYLFAIGNPRSDWMFRTEEEAGLNGRSLAYPRGKVIGGSSSINAMIYMRGQRSDYDHWAKLGNRGWSWDDVLPCFKRTEDYAHGGDELLDHLCRRKGIEPYGTTPDGELTIDNGAESVKLGPWDTCRIAPGEKRALKNETNRTVTVLLSMPLPPPAA